MDGGITDNLPFIDSKTTITVSPFYGESDICPRVKSTFLLHEGFTKLNMHLCTENLYLMFQSLFPPDVKVRGALSSGGAALPFASLFARGPSSSSGFPDGSLGKESACKAGDAGDVGSVPESGEGNGKPLRYSCLKHPRDRGAWRAAAPWGWQ